MAATYTKKDLIDELAKNTGDAKKRITKVLEEFAKIAYREARTENGFVIPGICKIDLTVRKERRARNPRTGEILLIGEHKVIRIRPLKRAKTLIAPVPADLIKILPPEAIPAPAPAPAAPAAPAAPEAAPAPAAVPAAEPAPAPASEDPLAGLTLPGGIPAAIPVAEPAADQAPAEEPPAEEEHFISFLCKSCGQEIEAPFDMAGSQDECPTCGAPIEVPYLSEPGTSQALKEEKAAETDIAAAKSRTLRIELPDDFL